MRQRASELFSKVKGTVVDSWYMAARNRTVADYAVMKSLSLEQWVQVGALANSSLLSLINISQLYQLYTSRNLPDERVIRLVCQQRESAVTSYKRASEAFAKLSYGAAIDLVNAALQEFNKTHLASYNIDEMQADKCLQAEMLLLKGVVLFHESQKKENLPRVIKVLEQALSLDPTLILACNLLVFIYYTSLQDETNAAKYLHQSLNLSPQQLFANYYQAKIHQGEETMQRMIDELIKLYQSKSSRDLSKAGESPEWSNLQATTLPFMVPYLFSDWLNYSAQHARKPETLASVANMCAQLSAMQSADVLNQCGIRILETRVHALQRLAKMKASALEFEECDKQWRDTYGVPVKLSDGSTQVCFEYPPAQVNRWVLQHFNHAQVNFAFLLEENYRLRMAAFIKEWVTFGWLGQDTNPEVTALCKLAKSMKHLHKQKRDEEEKKLLEACKSETLINHFVATYANWKNWDNLCRTVQVGPNLLSFLHFICESASVELHVHTREADNENENEAVIAYQQPFSCELMEPDQDTKTGKSKRVNVLYDAKQQCLTLLDLLDTPSRVYSRILVSDCWSLVNRDSLNKIGGDILRKKLACNAPLKIEPVYQSQWLNVIESTADLDELREAHEERMIARQIEREAEANTYYSFFKRNGQAVILTIGLVLVSAMQITRGTN